ncbi:lytic polysaccharide monooxygenase [Streptomyces sp. GC420]|uniref:lytic polysaccharide monooxygenase auxiliary activity family 9 protein n=1 Tax=Streptomyces sp. GC420 TaxID=2697568 RepID=UPI0014151F5D|nr:lytic polysaccharide monooxygenase [Streptomyces sp. GC420]NBM17244.1 chitin-binding protein [Streptomyces sp. GC420]
MTARRKAAAAAVLGVAPLVLTALATAPAAAHGSMTDPVSRVSACFAEGPESPDSAACKAAVAANGTQAFYDWNEVNIGDAAGRHKEIIPDGRLCSAGRDKYKGLDLARADWPSSPMSAGSHTFRYRATAPHRGGFELYITKEGYDPAKPLKWSDLEARPFAKVSDPVLRNGEYVFEGTVPGRSGRHLIYSIWQRTDSPEAFYTCSDVVFGGGSAGTGGSGDSGGGTQPAPAASAPTGEQIEDGAGESTVGHGGHGGDSPEETGDGTENGGGNGTKSGAADAATPSPGTEEGVAGNEPAPRGSAVPATGTANLAKTGGGSGTTMIAVGGAAALALGSVLLFTLARRRTR